MARTFIEALRALDQDALGRLLSWRTDLCYPLPQDLTELSARASTSTSVIRALDRLNAWQRLVCEVMAALDEPTSQVAVAQLMAVPEEEVREAVRTLLDSGLAWGNVDEIHLLRNARTAFGSYPCGLATPSAHPMVTDRIQAAVSGLAPAALDVLTRLAWGPPSGAVHNANRPVTAEAAVSPVEILLSRQLLRPIDDDTVILPREVALQLRQPATVSREWVPREPPAITGRSRSAGLVDKAAVGAALALLDDVELMITRLVDSPHRMLRSGGLAAKEVATLARKLSAEVCYAAFVVECAAAAGLVNTATNNTLLPTVAHDRWASQDAADRWQQLVSGWSTARRWFGRSGREGGHALGPEAGLRGATEIREVIMEVINSVEVGTTISTPELTAVVAWRRPRWARNPQWPLAEPVGDVLAEAGWLGLMALSCRSQFSTVLGSGSELLPSEVAELFPEPVEQLVIQSDLTAIAPGPLTHPVVTELRLLADQESHGGGGVFRFSAESLRRAFDAGWSQDEIESWLHHHSTTSVPQPLAYLVQDGARRHGSIRVGAAGAYIRTEDESHAAAILANPDAAVLQIRALAPGVLVSAADPDEVVGLLRTLGLAPAAEDARGQTLSAPPPLRAPAVPRQPAPTPVDPGEAAATIIATEREYQRLADATDQSLETLKNAYQAAQPVSIAFVDSKGARSLRTGVPITLGSGMVRMSLNADAGAVTIPLARISSVRAIAENG